MSKVKPFLCVRPNKEVADQVAALPYDVYNRKEAKEVVSNSPLSFLRIDRAETNFDDSVDTYADEVYLKARELYEEMLKKGSEVARAEAAKTLDEVRAAMKINYFDDEALIQSHVEKFNQN